MRIIQGNKLKMYHKFALAIGFRCFVDQMEFCRDICRIIINRSIDIKGLESKYSIIDPIRTSIKMVLKYQVTGILITFLILCLSCDADYSERGTNSRTWRRPSSSTYGLNGLD